VTSKPEIRNKEACVAAGIQGTKRTRNTALSTRKQRYVLKRSTSKRQKFEHEAPFFGTDSMRTYRSPTIATGGEPFGF
jgi:hypothetical protein